MSSSKWLPHFPYPDVRPVQAELLDTITQSWNQYDVFVVVLPVAGGKTAIAKTLMNLHTNAAYICPTNQLLDQLLQAHKGTPTLHRLDSYWCTTWLRPCSITMNKMGRLCKERMGEICPGCKQLGTDLSTAKYHKGQIATNYHTYLAHKLTRDLLIIDEAHTLERAVKDKMSTRIWQHDVGYPSNAYYYPQLIKWIESLSDRTRKGAKLTRLYTNLLSSSPELVVSRAIEDFNGKGTRRGEPEERDCLRLSPVDISQAPLFFFPPGTRKIVLLSATISRKDVEAMGLHRFSNRICYLECESPIPVESRPFVPLDALPVTKESMLSHMGDIAHEIDQVIQQHVGDRGIVHATYEMASKLRAHLTDPRYMFHTKEDKQEVYARFIKDKGDRVLVASGMYEGVDLPGDLGRFQVIAKVPWPNLGDPAVSYLCAKDPELYTWITLRTLIQAYGRICRTESDWGVTVCIDSTFRRLYDDGTRLELIPKWFQEAILDI